MIYNFGRIKKFTDLGIQIAKKRLLLIAIITNDSHKDGGMKEQMKSKSREMKFFIYKIRLLRATYGGKDR